MPQAGWYYRLSQFFRDTFGEKVFKIPLDAGMTCPNRDGTLSEQGCIFCYNPVFSPGVLSREIEKNVSSVTEQIKNFQLRSERSLKSSRNAENSENAESSGGTGSREACMPRRRYLAYFQSFSNTYAPLTALQMLYEEALSVPGVIGLSVATRPDCLQDEVLDLLADYSREYHIWLELGLQTIHDSTLRRINRGHSYACFEEAVRESHSRGLRTCVHIINGLPGEERQEMLETARVLAGLPIRGIKFHQLQIIEGTLLAEQYRCGEVKLLSAEEYLEIVCEQLERLREDIVVHRLLSEVTRDDLLLAPHWSISRADFAHKVEETLKARSSCQGKRFKNSG